jgi:hypothetical protein
MYTFIIAILTAYKILFSVASNNFVLKSTFSDVSIVTQLSLGHSLHGIYFSLFDFQLILSESTMSP